jgi:hypothetical protein
MKHCPSPNLASLDASEPGRFPAGTAMLAASSRKHIACGPAWERPGARPAVRSARKTEVKP